MPEIGDIRLANPGTSSTDEQRLVCVVGVDRVRHTADVCLVSNEIENAMQTDVVVAGSEAALPFDLVVEVEVVGRLWRTQIEPMVTRLPFGITQIIRRAVASGAQTIPSRRRGVLSADGDGPFLRIRMAERAAMTALAQDHRKSADAECSNIALVVDPTLFLSGLDANRGTSEDRFLGIAKRIAASDVSMVPSRVMMNQLEIHRYTDPSIIDRYGVEGAQVMMAMCERALVESPEIGKQNTVFQPRRTAAASDAEAELAWMIASLAIRGHTSVRLLTERTAWDGPIPDSLLAEANTPSIGCTDLSLEILEEAS
jgi:hypothetical protein